MDEKKDVLNGIYKGSTEWSTSTERRTMVGRFDEADKSCISIYDGKGYWTCPRCYQTHEILKRVGTNYYLIRGSHTMNDCYFG